MNVTIGDYGFLLNKVKSPAVSGTIGEAVVIPALTASMGINSNTFGFQRLKSRFKCPDFLVETMPEFDKLWNMTPGSSSKFPPDMPLEVKSRLTRDNGYPHTAVDQLKRYWSECKSIDPQRDGYGIIARVNIASSNITIRYYLFTK
ncbi:hypothetical protein [Brevibacillus formosus]|uniref:hypothetical protein n=2 Tax=Brevibacillus TaxID=55080 RepID=UPI003D2475A9